MPLTKIEKTTLRSLVYQQLKELIISAELLPGQRISLRKLAENLDVSTMPVREALWRLEAEKIVVIEDNKTIKVSELSNSELHEITGIRLLLEPEAAQIACDLRPERSLRKLKKLQRDMEESITNHKRYLKINREFHFSIYRLANAPNLLGIIDNLWARIGPYFNIQVIDSEHLRTVNTPCHERMLVALTTRDKDMIKDALYVELNATHDRVLPLLNNNQKSLSGTQ